MLQRICGNSDDAIIALVHGYKEFVVNQVFLVIDISTMVAYYIGRRLLSIFNRCRTASIFA